MLDRRPSGAAVPEGAGPASQTLMRGLDLIETIAQGSIGYVELARKLGLNKATTHRLASALVERGYLSVTPRIGYRLGPKLLELGFVAQSQVDLIQIARPHLEALSDATEDTVRLGVLDQQRVVYIEVVPGRRRITIASRPGDSQPLTSTSVGKALMLDEDEGEWRARLADDLAAGRPVVDPAQWLDQMRGFARTGYAFGMGENEDNIRGVAAPVRDASGRIAAAVSVTSPAQYMDDARMIDVSRDVCATAAAIGRELGFS
ncbi:IclR family transcriptional regulator [Sphingomonas sp. G-3-2-10]|nr:IclR family transcriptional regulator [Sphingomonas sp. G-3-2-10]